jgi:glycosyltransferase involved in cell wall biosynthesis
MGVEDAFYEPAPPGDVERVTRRYGVVPGKYILAIGTVSSRKNIAPVIEAMNDIRGHNADLRLLIAGPPGLGYQETVALVQRFGLEDRIKFLGWISPSDLRALLAASATLVHPALDEGFGMTPLEAMAAGIPAIVSNAGAVPDVTAGAALLVDPEDWTAWAAAISRVLEDTGLRDELVARGRLRSQEFTWRHVAGETVRAYRDALRLHAA